MRLHLAAALLSALIAPIVLAAQNASPYVAQVLRAEHARKTAFEAGHRQSLAKLILDDYVGFNRFGGRLGKLGELSMAPGAKSLQDQEEVRLYGNTAIVTGRSQFHDQTGALVAVRFTRVWIRTTGGWKLAAHHACVIAQPQ